MPATSPLEEASFQRRPCRWVEASCQFPQYHSAEVSACRDRRYRLGSDRLQQLRHLLHHRMLTSSAPGTGSEYASKGFVVTYAASRRDTYCYLLIQRRTHCNRIRIVTRRKALAKL